VEKYVKDLSVKINLKYLIFIPPGSNHISEIQFLALRILFLVKRFHNDQINFSWCNIQRDRRLQSINIPVILINFLFGKNLLEYRVNSEVRSSGNESLLSSFEHAMSKYSCRSLQKIASAEERRR